MVLWAWILLLTYFYVLLSWPNLISAWNTNSDSIALTSLVLDLPLCFSDKHRWANLNSFCYILESGDEPNKLEHEWDKLEPEKSRLDSISFFNLARTLVRWECQILEVATHGSSHGQTTIANDLPPTESPSWPLERHKFSNCRYYLSLSVPSRENDNHHRHGLISCWPR